MNYYSKFLSLALSFLYSLCLPPIRAAKLAYQNAWLFYPCITLTLPLSPLLSAFLSNVFTWHPSFCQCSTLPPPHNPMFSQSTEQSINFLNIRRASLCKLFCLVLDFLSNLAVLPKPPKRSLPIWQDRELEDGWLCQDVQRPPSKLIRRVRNQQAPGCFAVLCDSLCGCECKHAAMHASTQTDVSTSSTHHRCWEGAISTPLSHHKSLFLLSQSPTYSSFHLMFLLLVSLVTVWPVSLICFCHLRTLWPRLNPFTQRSRTSTALNQSEEVMQREQSNENSSPFVLWLILLINSTLYISPHLFLFLYLFICPNA